MTSPQLGRAFEPPASEPPASEPPASEPPASEPPASVDSSARRRVLSGMAENKLAVGAFVVVVVLVLFCFVGPLLYHTNQVTPALPTALIHPGLKHLLGTDEAGYDELGRLMAGGQAALEVGLAAALLASVFGTMLGAFSGFIGGWVDEVIMRAVDSAIAVPALVVILIVAAVVTPSVPTLILVISGVSWFNTCRLARSEALSLRTRDYVQASTSMGARSRWIVVRHIAPNLLGTVVVQATLSIATSILLLAGLSYLGLGPPPPAVNWGSMLSQGLNYALDGYWWLIYPPGVAIVLTVVAFNVLGDALRDVVEVRLQRR